MGFTPEVHEDPTVQQIAANNRGLLCRLLALQGLTELDEDAQRVVAGAHYALEQAIGEVEELPDDVAVWTDPTHPPVESDFTPEERMFILESGHYSPFFSIVATCMPGVRPVVDVPLSTDLS